VVPDNTIVLYVTQPRGDSTLGFYEDWNEAIITHELTHILHIDTVRGLPKVARWLMGQVIAPHQLAPAWTVEGYATLQETRHTLGGRGRSALVDMIKRTAVLEDAFPPLGNLDGFQVAPPSGNLRYLFGQDFMQFIADTRGTEKWSEWVRRYGASLPFILPAKRTFGASFVALYREWKAALVERYAAQRAAIEAEGRTEFTLVSPEGEVCASAAWSPDGKHLLYGCSSPKTGGRTYLAGPDGLPEPEEDSKKVPKVPKVVLKSSVARDVAWRGDSAAFAYTTDRTERYSSYDDVALYDLGSKKSRALTLDRRAREADFSPGGERIVVVVNDAQQTQLAVMGADLRVVPITAARDGEVFGGPRFSPDGKWIAVSVGREGRRDLWIYTADGKPWRRVTHDTAIDVDAAWSADGTTLYFTSDRSGVPNVYAVDLRQARLYRVTNVLTGAWAADPHPGGASLAMSVYTKKGARVATMPIDRSTWRDLGDVPRWEGAEGGFLADAGTPQFPGGNVAEPKRKVDEKVDPAYPFRHPVTPYDPVPTLLPPRSWVPVALLATTGTDLGIYAAAYTFGSDVLDHWAYSAYATYRTDANFLGGGGGITYNRWRPVFSMGASTYVTPYGHIYVSPPAVGGATIPSVYPSDQRYWDHRIRASTSAGYPIGSHSGAAVFLATEYRGSKDALPGGTYTPALPTRGWFNRLGGGWRYGKGESYGYSVSPEKARAIGIGMEYTPGWLGSYALDETGQAVAFDQFQVTADWREYITNPWVPNHVLALELTGGATLGSSFRYGSFRLGGSYAEGGITVVPDEWRSIRGFYPATDSGEWFYLGRAEYRLPLWWVDRGVGTFPFFLRNFSGAVFADAGNAFDEAEDADFSSMLLGAGAELRVSFVLGYSWAMTGRLGYAVPVLGNGVRYDSLDAWYASLGTSF
jgi:Tol biopolymer transport system component